MHASDLLAEWGRSLGLPHLALSELGTAALVVDGELTLNLEHLVDADRLVAWVTLGLAPADGREACFARLLEANLFGQDSGGGAIGLDRGSDELLLSRTFVLDHTDALALESGLSELVDAARRHRAGLQAAPGDAAATLAAGDAPFELPFGALLRA